MGLYWWSAWANDSTPGSAAVSGPLHHKMAKCKVFIISLFTWERCYWKQETEIVWWVSEAAVQVLDYGISKSKQVLLGKLQVLLSKWPDCWVIYSGGEQVTDAAGQLME